ncbi:hypothetical protein D3C72_1299790 [compost metagenome]
MINLDILGELWNLILQDIFMEWEGQRPAVFRLNLVSMFRCFFNGKRCNRIDNGRKLCIIELQGDLFGTICSRIHVHIIFQITDQSINNRFYLTGSFRVNGFRMIHFLESALFLILLHIVSIAAICF